MGILVRPRDIGKPAKQISGRPDMLLSTLSGNILATKLFFSSSAHGLRRGLGRADVKPRTEMVALHCLKFEAR